MEKQYKDDISYHGWHLDKRVSLGHIVSTLTITGVVVFWMTSLDKRITVAEINNMHQASALQSRASDYSVQYAEIIRRLERIDHKVDSAISNEFNRSNVKP